MWGVYKYSPGRVLRTSHVLELQALVSVARVLHSSKNLSLASSALQELAYEYRTRIDQAPGHMCDVLSTLL